MSQEEIEKQIRELTERMEQLESWKEVKEKQQLSYPLDQTSQSIIENI